MKRSVKVAIAITGIAALWLVSGQFSDGNGTDGGTAAPAASNRELFQVRVATLRAEPMVSQVVLNGRTVAQRDVTLRSEIRGQVEEVLAEKGAVLKAGDPIARIAVNARKADLMEARANLSRRKIEMEAASKLADKGYSSEIRRAEAKAQFEAAQAQVLQAELALEKTDIRAPFDGVLDDRMVEVGDFVDAKDPVARVIDLDPIKFVGFVSEREVSKISTGAKAAARTLEGEPVEGTVTFIASAADAAARTFPVEVQVPNADGRIVAGLTSEIRLAAAEKRAHRVSPAVLTLNDQGKIGVKLVGSDDVVVFQAVTILSSDPSGVWIDGLPETARVILVGQEFVAPGEKVSPVEVPGGLS